MDVLVIAKNLWTSGVQDNVVAWVVIGVLGTGLLLFWSWTKSLVKVVSRFANEKVAIRRGGLLLIAVAAVIANLLPSSAWVCFGLTGAIVVFCFYTACNPKKIIDLRLPAAALASPPRTLLTEEEQTILAHLLDRSSTQWVSSADVARRTTLGEQLVAHYLDQLFRKDLLSDHYDQLSGRSFRLSELGRARALGIESH